MIFLKLLFLPINLCSAFSMRQNWQETRNANRDSRNFRTIRDKLTATSTRRIRMDELHQQKLAKVRSFGRQIGLMQRRTQFE